MVKILLSKAVMKKLNKIPPHVKTKLKLWADSVMLEGVEEVRKIPSYHDEPLKGPKKGRRSIRLNRQWRAEYEFFEEEIIILVVEVHPHDY